MRLITYIRSGRECLGAWIDQDRLIVDLAIAAPGNGTFSSMLAFIEAGTEALNLARTIVAAPPSDAVFATSDFALAAPLPRPVQIRDCLCFPEHLKGALRVRGERMIAAAPDPDAKRAELTAAGFFEVPPSYFDFPVYYISNRMAVYGPDVDIIWPTYSNHIDYELEWAAVIGTAGSQISAAQARQHIFGYTIFNDWSARDEQARAMGGALSIGPGGGKDFANGLGPCIVTADEIPDPYNLKMTARINGAEVSSNSSAGMHFRFEDLIAFLSRGNGLYPGEVICSGTVGGGCSIETGIPVRPGDIVELEIEKIGKLRNRVLAPHLSR